MALDDRCKGPQMWWSLAWRRQAPPLLYTSMTGICVYSSGGACLRHVCPYRSVGCLQQLVGNGETMDELYQSGWHLACQHQVTSPSSIAAAVLPLAGTEATGYNWDIALPCCQRAAAAGSQGPLLSTPGR